MRICDSTFKRGERLLYLLVPGCLVRKVSGCLASEKSALHPGKSRIRRGPVIIRFTFSKSVRFYFVQSAGSEQQSTHRAEPNKTEQNRARDLDEVIWNISSKMNELPLHRTWVTVILLIWRRSTDAEVTICVVSSQWCGNTREVWKCLSVVLFMSYSDGKSAEVTNRRQKEDSCDFNQVWAVKWKLKLDYPHTPPPAGASQPSYQSGKYLSTHCWQVFVRGARQKKKFHDNPTK